MLKFVSKLKKNVLVTVKGSEDFSIFIASKPIAFLILICSIDWNQLIRFCVTSKEESAKQRIAWKGGDLKSGKDVEMVMASNLIVTLTL